MKILFRQSTDDKRQIDCLATFGIRNCYFKSIRRNDCNGDNAKKRHSHNGFEFHIMIEGSQIYESEDGRFILDSGNILAIPRGIPHSLVSCNYPLTKFAFTFSLSDGTLTKDLDRCILFPISDRIRSNIFAAESFRKETASGDALIENIVFETVFLLLNELGIALEATAGDCRGSVGLDIDERVELAVQFIGDNIESPLQVCEVSSYCYISEKHLNRLFMTTLGMSVAAYIRQERLRRIEGLLSDTRLSLSEISDRFGFPSEHGFNVFFKKYNGMPPGEYRKMTNNGKA